MNRQDFINFIRNNECSAKYIHLMYQASPRSCNWHYGTVGTHDEYSPRYDVNYTLIATTNWEIADIFTNGIDCINGLKRRKGEEPLQSEDVRFMWKLMMLQFSMLSQKRNIFDAYSHGVDSKHSSTALARMGHPAYSDYYRPDGHTFADGWQYDAFSIEDSHFFNHEKSNQKDQQEGMVKFDPHSLIPMQLVLVRNDKFEEWELDLFLYINKRTKLYQTAHQDFKHCIPFNAQTEHLLKTIQNPPKYYDIFS